MAGDVSRRPELISLAAVALRALTLLGILGVIGGQSVGHHLHLAWTGVVAGAQLLTYPAYVLAYRSTVRFERRTAIPMTVIARIVLAGFGPVAVAGGFAADQALLGRLDGHEDASGARRLVAMMATLEWLVLASAAGGVAVGLLLAGVDVSGTLLWPWAIGIPLAFLAVATALGPGRSWFAHPFGHDIALLRHALEALDAVRRMLSRPREYAGAWIGMALYWSAEIGAFSGALHVAGLHLGPAETVLAYATGYLASRRSLPLGGAGLVEALLLYSLYQLGEPLSASFDAVMAYRIFNFAIVVIPALLAYRGLPAAVASGASPVADRRP